MKKLIIAIACISYLGLPAQADQATADAVDNLNIGLWSRYLIGNGEGFTGFCNLTKSATKKVFAKKTPKTPKVQEVSNGNIIIDGKEYIPMDKVLNEKQPKVYKAPTGYSPVGNYLLSVHPVVFTGASSSSNNQLH